MGVISKRVTNTLLPAKKYLKKKKGEGDRKKDEKSGYEGESSLETDAENNEFVFEKFFYLERLNL
jgi:hypothetical protein